VSVARLELRRCERILDPPQANARGVWTRRSTLELSLGGADGRGRGEAAPLPDYSPDRLEDCERALAALDATRLPAFDLGGASALLDAAAAAIPAALPAARFALETALLDRAGRRSGQPLWRLLSELVPGTAAARPIEICALLPSADPARALELARRGLADGVRSFKLKLGPEQLGAAQEATLERLRGGLDGGVALRLDANRSLSRATLGETLERVSRYDIEFLEEPLFAPAPEDLAASPCPIALDESLQGISDGELARLLATGSVHVLVLKPTALGGFGACIRLARTARAQGCEAVVSHALEGPLGWAACAHLALALQGARAVGLSPLAHQLAPLPRIVHGQLVPPSEPGLGADG
jgi:o-succinylbenzoate synthase